MTALMREAAGQDHVAGLDRAASDLVSFTTSRAIVTGENARRNSSIAVASALTRSLLSLHGGPIIAATICP